MRKYTAMLLGLSVLFVGSAYADEPAVQQTTDGMLNEASEKSNVKKKGKKKKSKQVLKHQVVSLLSQDKIDMAAIGREVYPKMDDDTLRSYISKIARGKEQIPDNKVNDFFKALRTFNGKKTKK